MKVGTIGAGGIGNAHANALSKIEGVEFVAVADIIKERADAFAGKFGGKSYNTYKRVLDSDADVVYVCTPPHVHKRHCIDAARAGKHIFAEKPLALSLKDVDEILDAVSQAGIKFTVGYVLHFHPNFKKFKEVFASGQLGELVTAWSRRMGGFPGTPWLVDPKKSGGMTVEFYTHDLDWLRWVGGEVREVYAKTLRVNPNSGIEDNIWAILSFDKGIGIGGASWWCAVGNSSLGIIGTEGAIIQDANGQVLMRRMDGEQQVIELAGVDAMCEENKAFFEAIRNNAEPEISGNDARAALEIALAIQKSSRLGRKVKLPL